MSQDKHQIDINQLSTIQEGVLDHWEATAENVDLFGVAAVKSNTAEYQWSIVINAAEFIREEPLETKFRSKILDSLKGLKSVNKIEEVDREVWVVDGDPGGRALLDAVIGVLIELEPEISECLG